MFLEGDLEVAKGLDLVHERYKLRVVLRVEEVVLKNSEFVWVWQSVVVAVFALEKRVDLGRRKFVGITALHLSDHRVAWFDALAVGLTDEVATDDPLGHRHRARWRVERRKVEISSFQRLSEGKEPPVFNNELGHRVVLTGEF